MKEHEYNPAHIHRGTLFTGLSSVMILKLPSTYGREYSNAKMKFKSGPIQLPLDDNAEFELSAKRVSAKISSWPYEMVKLGDASNIEEGQQKIAEIQQTGIEDQTSITALNGPQVTALMEVLQSIGAGQIPRESGIQIISASFGFSIEQSERIVGDLGSFIPTVVENV